MRILVDLTHPAHVHFFRHPIALWRRRGHEVVIATRDKDLAVDLVARLDLAGEGEIHELGAARSGLGGLAVELLGRTARLRRLVARLEPDVMTAIGGVFIAQAAWWSSPFSSSRRVPTVVFYDTENATLSNLLTYPFCSRVVTPRCYLGRVPARKHLVYDGYHELSYTHPARFTPDPARLAAFGLEPGEPFLFMRLVSWGASHDVRDHGFTAADDAVRELERFGRVVISSEAPLPPGLDSRRLRGPIEDVHHLLAFARLYIGESATMASEAATLGTPAIFVSTSTRGYTDEQGEKYGLTYTFSDPHTGQRDALAKALEILGDPGSAARFEEARRRMLGEVIDVAEHVADVVEAEASRG